MAGCIFRTQANATDPSPPGSPGHLLEPHVKDLLPPIMGTWPQFLTRRPMTSWLGSLPSELGLEVTGVRTMNGLGLIKVLGVMNLGVWETQMTLLCPKILCR